MPNIYQNKAGQSVYDMGGQSISASTGLPVGTPPSLSPDALSGAATPIRLPEIPTTDPASLQATTAAIPSLDAALAAYATPSTAESMQGDFRTRILNTLKSLSGKGAATAIAENAAGIPQLQSDLQGLNSRLTSLQNESAAIPLKVQEQFTGSGATIGGAEPIQTSMLRKNAIEALSVSAIAQAKQGQLDLAQKSVDRAIDLEFAPQQAELDYLKQAYTFNQDDLERQDKKKADMLNASLQERQRILDDAKTEKANIYSVLKTASQYGASSEVLNAIQSSASYGDALVAAGQYIQDPKAKYELQSAILDNKLKQAQIDKTNKETALLGEPTGKEKKEAADALLNAAASAQAAQDKINQIALISTSNALGARVGTRFGRGGAGALYQDLTGSGQSFAGYVHRLTNGLTLQNLIDAKANGAIFGALSEGELQLLSQSASALNDWEVKDKAGNGTGYWDVDEGSFNREVQRIKNLTAQALEKSGKTLLQDDEQSLLDTAFDTNTFDPAGYFK